MPAIIAALLAALSRMLMIKAGVWVLSALSFMGLSVATHTFAVEPLLNQIIAVSNSFPADAAMWLRFFNFDKAITIIVSAVNTKYSIQSAKAFLTGGG